MRSQGQVRFITITPRLQMIAAGTVLAALLAWGVTMAIVAWSQYSATAERMALSEREAKVATAEERMGAYSDDLKAVTEDLTRRQDFLDEMMKSVPDDLKADAVQDSSGEAAATVEKVGAAIPEAAGLARIEARQLAFVESLTRLAEHRSRKAESAIRSLGLDPRTIMASADTAIGGPLERLSTNRDGTIDPRFEKLGLSLARMRALEEGLAGIPQVEPASLDFVSSGFGYRRDPFNGGGAMHSGLDFRGPTGAPIYAAAKGRVSFVGYKGGYGKTVEIDHGNGLMTRYAHMSAFGAAPGQEVEAGKVIGAIGSTGRSTGPHLHFEVRIDGRAVNPRPFLERAGDVRTQTAAVRRTDARGSTNG